MRYQDFDLEISRGPDGTVVLRSRSALHGEHDDVARIDIAALDAVEEKLSRGVVDRPGTISYGTSLYQGIFEATNRAIEYHFALCLGSQTKGAGVLDGVRVRVMVSDPELASIPWEYLFSQRERAFVAVSERTPIVRFLPLPRPIAQLRAELPVRMLVVIPEGSGLDVEAEMHELQEALAPLAGVVELVPLTGTVTRARLEETLGAGRFHLFHFIGHGDFADNRAVLVFSDGKGGFEHVDHERMASLFRNHPSMKLVVLNSCLGGHLSSTKPFVGMAAELVRLGVPAVIAMQYEIPDEAALCFAKVLYRKLFVGDDRGRIEIAISHARNALADEAYQPYVVGLPVLYMHAEEGILFTTPDESAGWWGRARALLFSARAAEGVKAAIRTHERNLALLADPHTAESSASMAREEASELRREKGRLRARNVSIASLVGIVAVLALLALALGFQRLPPAVRPEQWFVALSDMFGHADHEENIVTMVAIDARTLAALHRDSLDGSWRGMHARVLDRLRELGAATVVFNLSFADRPDPALRAVNDSLVAAARRAHDARLPVLIAVGAMRDGAPDIQEGLRPLVRWGVNCLEPVSFTSAHAMRVAVAKGHGDALGRIPSLPLAAVAAYARTDFVDRAPMRRWLQGDGSSPAPTALMLDSTIAREPDSPCLVQPGDTVYRTIIDYSPHEALHAAARHVSYADLLDPTKSPAVRDRLVMIGTEREADLEDAERSVHILRGLTPERRFRWELLADAINTMHNGTRIAPLGAVGQTAVIAFMVLLGAGAAWLAARRGMAGAAVGAVLALVLYFVLGAALYSSQHLLLNTAFDLLALSLAFAAVWKARRIWFP